MKEITAIILITAAVVIILFVRSCNEAHLREQREAKMMQEVEYLHYRIDSLKQNVGFRCDTIQQQIDFIVE